MLRFDLLQLDCNDHLFIYDGAHAVGSFKVLLSASCIANSLLGAGSNLRSSALLCPQYPATGTSPYNSIVFL
jgi:hypothetical protein